MGLVVVFLNVDVDPTMDKMIHTLAWIFSGIARYPEEARQWHGCFYTATRLLPCGVVGTTIPHTSPKIHAMIIYIIFYQRREDFHFLDSLLATSPPSTPYTLGTKWLELCRSRSMFIHVSSPGTLRHSKCAATAKQDKRLTSSQSFGRHLHRRCSPGTGSEMGPAAEAVQDQLWAQR